MLQAWGWEPSAQGSLVRSLASCDEWKHRKDMPKPRKDVRHAMHVPAVLQKLNFTCCEASLHSD